MKEADNFNSNLSNDIHNAEAFTSQRDQQSHVAYNPYEWKVKPTTH